MSPTLQASATWRALLLVLTASLLLEKGRGTSVLGGPNELLVGDHGDVPSAIESLQSGDTLQLEIKEVRLDSTLFIATSDIAILGADGMTTVRCPAEGGVTIDGKEDATSVQRHLKTTKRGSTQGRRKEKGHDADMT